MPCSEVSAHPLAGPRTSTQVGAVTVTMSPFTLDAQGPMTPPGFAVSPRDQAGAAFTAATVFSHSVHVSSSYPGAMSSSVAARAGSTGAVTSAPWTTSPPTLPPATNWSTVRPSVDVTVPPASTSPCTVAVDCIRTPPNSCT